MLNIDESNILTIKRDELGTWTAEVNHGETNLECSWDAAAPEEQAEEREHAVRHFLDTLGVSVVRDMIGDGEEDELDDCDVLAAILAAERIGDDEIGGIVVEAWARSILAVKPPATGRLITYEEAMASRRAEASVYTHCPGDGEVVRQELESRGVVWPIGGHAPGERYLRCYDCSWSAFGDKETIRCLRCAVVAVRDQHEQDVSERDEIAVRLAEREAAVGIYDQSDDLYPRYCVDVRRRLISLDEVIAKNAPLVAMLEGLPQ